MTFILSVFYALAAVFAVDSKFKGRNIGVYALTAGKGFVTLFALIGHWVAFCESTWQYSPFRRRTG